MKNYKVDLNVVKRLLCYSLFLDKSVQRGLLLWDECIDYIIEKTKDCDIPYVNNISKKSFEFGSELFHIENRGYFYQVFMPMKKNIFMLFGKVSESDFNLLIRCIYIIKMLKLRELNDIDFDERKKLRLFFRYFCGEFDYLLRLSKEVNNIEYFNDPKFLDKKSFKSVYHEMTK